MLDLKDIQYFVAVYETGGFLKASYGLHTVQSNVSLRIARLESKLGEALFIRKRRGVEATPAADELYGRATHVLQSVNALETRFAPGAIRSPREGERDPSARAGREVQSMPGPGRAGG